MQKVRAKKPSLLVVDDNVNDVEIVRIALDSLGYGIKMQKAFDGETAIRLLSDGHCRADLVLLDLKLPGMSGIDVLRKIRSDEKFKNLPVLVSSSSMLDSDQT